MRITVSGDSSSSPVAVCGDRPSQVFTPCNHRIRLGLLNHAGRTEEAGDGGSDSFISEKRIWTYLENVANERKFWGGNMIGRSDSNEPSRTEPVLTSQQREETEQLELAGGANPMQICFMLHLDRVGRADL